MPTIPDGISYGNGKVYAPNGSVFFEFERDLNLDLHEALVPIADWVGKEVDISGLPDVLVLDGTTYNIVRDDARPEINAIISDIQTAFNLPTEQHARAAARLIWKIARRF